MAADTAPWAPFHVPGIPGRRARDRILMACRDAWHWDVLITGTDGQCIGAIISPADAEILREARARLAAETEATSRD